MAGTDKQAPDAEMAASRDAHRTAAESRAVSSRIADDEPEPTLEDDLPSDGRDHQGEEMIRDLPANSDLAPLPSSPDDAS